MVKRIPLLVFFFLALFACVCASIWISHLKLHTFVPFLPLLYSRCSRISSLWISSLSGLILDLLTTQLRFGAHAMSFAIATLLLYQQKKHFNEEKPLALSLFTCQLSLIITMNLYLFSLFSYSSFSLSAKWFAVDLFFMSLLDSLYAFLWFSCPMLLYRHLQTHLKMKKFSLK